VNDEARALISNAVAFAASHHHDQRRKDARATPYIFHPMRVMFVLWDAGIDDPVVLSAALLHDTVEDTEATHANLVARFGEEVAAVVAQVTDDKRLPKSERKRLQIVEAADKSPRAKLVKLADKIMNVQDMLHSPPEGWSELRCKQYLGWSKSVVDAMRGCHAQLEARFDALLHEVEVAPWPMDGSEARR